MNSRYPFSLIPILIIGMVAGIISMITDGLLKISIKIVESGVVPWYSTGVLSLIVLPMIFGVIATTIYLMVTAKITLTSTLNLFSLKILIGLVFGAVGAVAWWVVPLALFGISCYWLFLTSMYGSFAIGMITTVIFGSIAKTPHYIYPVSLYLSGAIGGAVLGVGLGVFVTEFVKGISGPKAWVNKIHPKLGAILGALVGVIYSIFYVWYYIINGVMLFD